ncbi:MAG: CocE/NonD family hydrolase [Gammaproteobacteria bacterium]|nr:CocE/NonD family hydrolase [Gammaproteobacteria bacterium]
MNTEVIDEFPCQIREVEHETIPLADGTRLALRYWLPVDADTSPVPAILEYIPYCKRDGTAARDEAMHPYFAGHGYAALRVDIRGSGESEGVLLDEYLALEQDDAIEVIGWIAAQPWCNGKVGMMGKSWGGFNGLQVATRQPDALKCIITVFFTDDRYADDVHYIGGCMALENPAWAFVMFPAMSRPPDPTLVGDAWREMWQQRLAANRPWAIDWVRHQRRDDYWKHGSVCEDFSQIKIPVYAIGGWADPYSNPVPRLLAGLDVPCKGLIGPWGHQYMHQATPGPKMGFMDEALRWWDYWLKDVDDGIMDEPQYRVWMQDSLRPSACHPLRPGHWVSEPRWLSPNIGEQTLYLDGNRLGDLPGAEIEVVVNSPQTTGQCTPFFGNMGAGEPQDPLDQRTDDAVSACFDGEVLAQELAILGAPLVTLDLAANQPNAFVCVRLNELLACGESLQVSYGLLNLTHRNSHEHIEPLEPGKRYPINVVLNDIAHTFAAGSRIRIAVSNAFWPVVWPSPQAARLSLFTAHSRLTLPIRTAQAGDDDLTALAPARQSRVSPQTITQAAVPMKAEFTTDLASGRQTFTYATDTGAVLLEDNGWCFSCKTENRYHIHADDPGSAVIDSRTTETYGREGQLDVRIEAHQVMTSDATHFHIEASIEAYENDESVFRKQWQESIERDGV